MFAAAPTGTTSLSDLCACETTTVKLTRACDRLGFVRNGRSTYCWALSVDSLVSTPAQENVIASGSGASCPFAIALTTAAPSISVNEALDVTWVVTTANATALTALMNSTGASSTAPLAPRAAIAPSDSSNTSKSLAVTHSAIHVCARRNASTSSSNNATEDDACDPFSAVFQSANASAIQRMSLSSFADRDSLTFISEGEVSFASPGEYTLVAYVVVPGARASLRYDSIAFTTVTVVASTHVHATADDRTGADSDSRRTKASNPLPFGVSTGQFVMLCVLLALVVTCAVVALVLVAKRKRTRVREAQKESNARAKVSQMTVLSPVTGDSQQLRYSDWSEIYATQDALPHSILVDDSNTIAILRASRVSSPAHTERRIADFTRDVGYWDIRPSASPITPLSSFFFSSSASSSVHGESDSEDRVLASPTDGFVALETLGRRRTRPCYADALDDDHGRTNDDDDDDDDAHEVEF